MPRVRGGRYPATSTGRAYPNVGGVRGGRFPATNTGVQFPPVAGGLSEDLLRWLVNVDVIPTAISHVNWDTISAISAYVYNGYKGSSSAQNDEINFDVVLSAGTWTFELIHTKTSARGIYTVQLDGITIGTIDGYNSTTINNARSQITGVAVAIGGKKRVKLLMATKNASSSGYGARLIHFQFKRTA